MPKWKLPRSMTILGRRVRIREGAGLYVHGQKCWGYYCQETDLIMIEKEQSDKSKYRTLAHELGHVFHVVCGYDLTDSPREAESFCQLFAAVVEDIQRQLK